ncbi:WhiB family transcriptional regulator [Corynebacterium sputi]|uniref:WhiB family transcriptional regulator n=1 Tax=Corynebacterium sputi TaxID=489915 RepID=UPI0004109853|nr:WhiB family transcriptional regulator [Corynebacterium sputi]
MARRTGRAAAAPKIEDMPELSCIGRDHRLDGAACAGYPLPLWDESVHGEATGARDERHRVAALICQRCPVNTSCSAIAAELAPSDRAGIWAGNLFRQDPA